MTSEYEAAGGGGCVGMVVAFFLSWISNHSIVWGILHAFLSWFYVIYWMIKHL